MKMSKSSLYLVVAVMVTLLMGVLLFNSIQSSNWSNEQSTAERAKNEIVFADWAYIPSEIFDKFSQEYPDISVNYQHYNLAGFSEVIQQKMIMGETLDLVGIMNNELSQYVSQGWLTDLSENAYLSRFQPEMVSAIQSRGYGKVYAIPYEAEYYGIWYNKILFDKYKLTAPRTFQEFLSVCEVLKQHDVDPLVVGARDAESAAYIFLLRIFKAIDEESKWNEYRAGSRRFTDPDTISLFLDTQRLIDDGYISPDSINLTYQQAFDSFKNAKAAMLIAPDASFNMAKDDFEKVCDPQVFVIPYADYARQSKTFTDYSTMLIGISNTSNNPEAAEKLLNFLTRPDVVQIYCEETVSYPTTENADTSYLKYNVLWKPVRENTLQETPFASLSIEGRAALNVLAQQLIAGLIDAKEVATQFDQIIKSGF